MNQQLVVGCGAVLLLLACGDDRFEGFKPVNDEVHFKLRMLGDGERLPTDSDSAFVRVRVALHGDEPGSLFSTERWFGDISTVLPDGAERRITFHEGDSVSLVARARRIPWDALAAERGHLSDTSWVDVELSLHALRSRAESRRLAEERWRSRTAADEEAALAGYFTRDTSTWARTMGIFHQIDHPSPRKPRIQSGQLVTIAYTARFLHDGQLFDDTYSTRQPLTFRLGDPGQVIRGLEVAVHLLPKGGRGRFIIPSELAFGPDGSSGRIVPPWTPVLYEVEVLDASALPVVNAKDTARLPL